MLERPLARASLIGDTHLDVCRTLQLLRGKKKAGKRNKNENGRHFGNDFYVQQ